MEGCNVASVTGSDLPLPAKVTQAPHPTCPAILHAVGFAFCSYDGLFWFTNCPSKVARITCLSRPSVIPRDDCICLFRLLAFHTSQGVWRCLAHFVLNTDPSPWFRISYTYELLGRPSPSRWTRASTSPGFVSAEETPARRCTRHACRLMSLSPYSTVCRRMYVRRCAPTLAQLYIARVPRELDTPPSVESSSFTEGPLAGL